MTLRARHILYSFRRCPFAMRARMALHVSEIDVEHREVVLKNKPPQMLSVSPKGTVPVLVTQDGQTIDESFDIMLWALEHHDPDEWLSPSAETHALMLELIKTIDGPFKEHLDRYKYANRYAGAPQDAPVDPIAHREAALRLLQPFEKRLEQSPYLFGHSVSLADMATFPFIRQFANTDRQWFDGLPTPCLIKWLGGHLSSPRFEAIMKKHSPWTSEDNEA